MKLLRRLMLHSPARSKAHSWLLYLFRLPCNVPSRRDAGTGKKGSGKWHYEDCRVDGYTGVHAGKIGNRTIRTPARLTFCVGAGRA